MSINELLIRDLHPPTDVEVVWSGASWRKGSPSSAPSPELPDLRELNPPRTLPAGVTRSGLPPGEVSARVLHAFRGGPATFADVMQRTGFSRIQVCNAVHLLILRNKLKTVARGHRGRIAIFAPIDWQPKGDA